MKIVNITKSIIDLLQNAGKDGINNFKIADLIETPMRRVYDVIAILHAAGFIKKKRTKDGTKIIWLGKTETVEKKIQILTEEINQLKQRNQVLLEQNKEVRAFIDNVQQINENEPIATSAKPIKFCTPNILVIAESPGQITRTSVKGVVATIETNAPSVTIKPILKKTLTPFQTE
ncbi:MAG: hypothetical protein ACTSUV_04725 [Candidatus Ranarchaeia archaeon]